MLLTIIHQKQATLADECKRLGINDPEVYRLSCELDELIVRYMKTVLDWPPGVKLAN